MEAFHPSTFPLQQEYELAHTEVTKAEDDLLLSQPYSVMTTLNLAQWLTLRGLRLSFAPGKTSGYKPTASTSLDANPTIPVILYTTTPKGLPPHSFRQ